MSDGFIGQQTLCLCCSDLKRYQQALDSVRRITTILRQRIPPGTKECQDFEPLALDGHHIHFMCGQCHQVGNELPYAELGLKKLLRQAAMAAKDDNTLYHETLRLLQGEFPVTYRTFEKNVKRG